MILPVMKAHMKLMAYIVQDCSNSSALAMELLQSWAKPLKWNMFHSNRYHNQKPHLTTLQVIVVSKLHMMVSWPHYWLFVRGIHQS